MTTKDDDAERTTIIGFYNYAGAFRMRQRQQMVGLIA